MRLLILYKRILLVALEKAGLRARLACIEVAAMTNVKVPIRNMARKIILTQIRFSCAAFVHAAIRPMLLAAMVVIGSPLAGQSKETPIRVDVELVLAVDISFSMDPEEQRFQRAGYVRALTSREFLSAVKNGIHGKIAVTYFQWANYKDTNVLLPWTIIDGPASAKAAADKLAEAPFRRARRTSISGAIEKAMLLLDNHKFKGLRQVIDISGDGTNNDGGAVNLARDAALKKGIIINGLPLMIRPSNWGFSDISNLDEYYDDCVTGGPGSFVIPIKDRKQFIRAIRTKLVLEIAVPAPGILPAVKPVHRDIIYVQGARKRSRVDCQIGEKMWRERWGR